ncbi:MAG: type II secretion system protein GspL [Pseudomonadota bacterium]
MSTLIVSLPLPSASAAAAADFAYVLTADGHHAVRQARAPAALLPHPGRAGETVALVPARALSWQRVELPRGVKGGSRGGQAPRLRAVLDGLLEDRLLDDPQALHFALAPDVRAGEAVWVAVCDRAWLRACLQLLEAAGRSVARVVPEFAPDDAADPQLALCAIGTPDDALLAATGERPGSGVTLLPLSAAALALVDAARTEATPLLAEPAVAALAETLAGRPVQLQTTATRWMAAARSGWDLAQFDLANSGRNRAVRRAGSLAGELLRAPQWRAARWGAGLFAAAQLVGLNAWAWKEGAALDHQEAAVRSVLTSTFPTVQVVVDAPVQMERQLALLRQATGTGAAGDLDHLLAAIGTALPAGRSAAGIEYSGTEARLQGLGLGADETAHLAGALRGQGLAARTDGEALVVRPAEAP